MKRGIQDVSKRDADIGGICEDVGALKVDGAVLKGIGGTLQATVTALFSEAFFRRSPPMSVPLDRPSNPIAGASSRGTGEGVGF